MPGQSFGRNWNNEARRKSTEKSRKLFVDRYIGLHFFVTVSFVRVVYVLDCYNDRPYRMSEKRPCIATEAAVFDFNTAAETLPAGILPNAWNIILLPEPLKRIKKTCSDIPRLKKGERNKTENENLFKSRTHSRTGRWVSSRGGFVEDSFLTYAFVQLQACSIGLNMQR